MKIMQATKCKRVRTLRELDWLVAGKKSVIVPSWRSFAKPKPAAFMLNLSGGVLVRMFRAGMYLYRKEQEG